MSEPELPPINFTFDLEDSRVDGRRPPRYGNITRSILDFLDARAIKGTFFVVGEVAQADPALIRLIAARGHEIAFHSQRHRMLTLETALNFRSETEQGKAFLEDLLGIAVKGFRAPAFSLTPKSRWTLSILADLGFTYSSSVIPGSHPYYGYPGLPQRPFMWAEGLVELPCPAARFGPFILPYLGGIYVRSLPTNLVRKLALKQDGGVRWTYLHPYDFDVSEPFHIMKGTSFAVSLLLWLNRSRTWRVLRALPNLEGSMPMAQIAARVANTEMDYVAGSTGA